MSRSVTPRSGSCDVTRHRPTSPLTTISASPTLHRRSDPLVFRVCRHAIDLEHHPEAAPVDREPPPPPPRAGARASRARPARPCLRHDPVRGVFLGPEQGERPADGARDRLLPRPDHATGRMRTAVELQRDRLTELDLAGHLRAVRKAERELPRCFVPRGRIVIIGPFRLLLKSRPSASTSQKRRSPCTPSDRRSTLSGWTSPSDFTGAIEIRTTWASTDQH